MGVLSGGELVVVETDEGRTLGTVEVPVHVLVVRTRGREQPTRLAHEDVLPMTSFGELVDELEE